MKKKKRFTDLLQ